MKKKIHAPGMKMQEQTTITKHDLDILIVV